MLIAGANSHAKRLLQILLLSPPLSHSLSPGLSDSSACLVESLNIKFLVVVFFLAFGILFIVSQAESHASPSSSSLWNFTGNSNL